MMRLALADAGLGRFTGRLHSAPDWLQQANVKPMHQNGLQGHRCRLVAWSAWQPGCRSVIRVKKPESGYCSGLRAYLMVAQQIRAKNYDIGMDICAAVSNLHL